MTKFQCHTFFLSEDIKQNALLSSYLVIINFKIYLPSSSKRMANREKEEKTETEKFEYDENEKSFLDEIKSIFHNK